MKYLCSIKSKLYTLFGILPVMRKTTYLIAILFAGCVSTKELFTSLQKSEQDNYGYSKENPILIGQYNNWQKNADLALLYFIVVR